MNTPIRNHSTGGQVACYSAKSPLRYFGGKSRAVKLLWTLMFPRPTKIVSPFAGGLSFELFCASQGIQVCAYDLEKTLVNFYECAFADPVGVANQARKYLQINKYQFKHLQRACPNIKNDIERAAVYFALNRASYSGATLTGGMSPGHKRFNQNAINNLANFQCHNISIGKADFSDSLARHPDALAFLDPPYKIRSNVYGINGDLQREFDHERLAMKIKERKSPFLLCYEDSPERREMYREYLMIKPCWKYGASKTKESKELLILSHHFEKRVRELKVG